MFKQAFEHAQKTARLAGEFLLSENDGKIESLEGRDIKMEMDKKSEALIIENLRNTFSYPVLSEEVGLVGADSLNGVYWIIDPIDGTMNYSRNNPACCVSIALWQDYKPILGVVYDFNHNEMFAGMVGNGVYVDGQKVERQPVNKKQAILATGFPTYLSSDENVLLDYVSLIKSYKKIRMIGSAALSVAYVAAGRFDAYMEHSVKLWDVAAGIAMCSAANVKCEYTDIDESYGMNLTCSAAV